MRKKERKGKRKKERKKERRKETEGGRREGREGRKEILSQSKSVCCDIMHFWILERIGELLLHFLVALINLSSLYLSVSIGKF